MTLLKASGLLVATGILFTLNALAQSTTSVTTTDQVAPQKKALPITVTDLSMFYGPGVTDPTSGKTIDSTRAINPATQNTVDSYTGLNSRHFLGATYQIDEKLSIGPTFDFNFLMSDPAGANRFSLNDPYLKLSRAGLYEQHVGANDVAVDGDVRYYAPLSQGARTNGTAGAVRMTVVPSIVFGKSDFSFGAVNYVKGWIQPRGATKDMPMFQAYTGPQLNYTAGKRVTAFVLYEALANWGTLGSTDSPLTSQADIEPGMDIKVHERVTLSPYLNWYPNQSIKTTSVNLNAEFKLL